MVTRTAHGLQWKLSQNAVWRSVAMSIGIDLYTHTEDRRMLEKVILPQFADPEEFRRIVFIGCDWYTRGYRRFFPQQEFWTVDVDPKKARYGAMHHVTDCVTNVDRHFGRGEIDLIVCNGVYGWGLNERNDVEKAFWAFRRVLRPGGVFVLGWNDTPERAPVPLDECASLRSFNRYDFPGLGRSRFLTSTPYRHTYDFYLR
jgi:SAM-dependent methyltransferase